MLELVKMYNSDNSDADNRSTVYFGGCFEYENRKSSAVQIILTLP